MARTTTYPESQAEEIERLRQELVAAREHLAEREAQVVEREGQLTGALEQLTATRDVLRTIAQTPAALQRVFETVAAQALRLCDANDVRIARVQGERLVFVVERGPLPHPPQAAGPIRPGVVTGRAIVE